MARTPSDATRFTSTGPYVSTKPSNSTSFASNPFPSSSNQINFGSAPPNETPLQKIARLRAAAQLAKQGSESGFDKTVRIGRVWADRAHRVTALGLIGFTILATGVAVAGITDMMMHNRRRRKEWLAQKKAEGARDLAIARQAQAAGIASEDHILLINRERNAVAVEEAKKNRPGLMKRASNYLFSDLSEEEQKGGKLGAAAAAADSAVVDVTEQVKNEMWAVGDRIDSQRRTGEMVTELLRPSGGPLDREAQAAVDSAARTAGSWTSWITGRR